MGPGNDGPSLHLQKGVLGTILKYLQGDKLLHVYSKAEGLGVKWVCVSSFPLLLNFF